MKGYINHRMVRHFDNGALRIDNVHLDKTKFKWTLKNPCKICLVKACCSKTREFSCDDIICHEITWNRISRISKNYIFTPMIYLIAMITFHFGQVYLIKPHLSRTTILILYIALSCVVGIPTIKLLVWILKSKKTHELM